MEPPRTANLATDQTPRADDADEGLDPLPTLTGPLRCAAHPKTETYLRCGKCEKPICPRCMIQTPVGARCRQCAGLRRLPMFDVRPLDLVKGFLSAVAASAAGAAIASPSGSQNTPAIAASAASGMAIATSGTATIFAGTLVSETVPNVGSSSGSVAS
jgi:hypothetical protein